MQYPYAYIYAIHESNGYKIWSVRHPSLHSFIVLLSIVKPFQLFAQHTLPLRCSLHLAVRRRCAHCPTPLAFNLQLLEYTRVVK